MRKAKGSVIKRLRNTRSAWTPPTDLDLIECERALKLLVAVEGRGDVDLRGANHEDEAGQRDKDGSFKVERQG